MLECSVDNCNNTSENTTVYTENCKFGRDLCERHYNQMLRLGKILKRTRYDPNEIVKYDDYAEVVLYNNDGIEVARTKIDLEDIKKIKEFKWYRDDKGYAFNGTENRKMHRVILDLVKYRDSKIKVDHINGDPLDNRKENLRKCTHAQNLRNRNFEKGSENFNGISFNKLVKKWETYITVNDERIRLGFYKDKIEAMAARLEAEIKYYGEYAGNNYAYVRKLLEENTYDDEIVKRIEDCLEELD